VLWGWAGDDVPPSLLDELTELRSALHGPLGSALSEHLSRAELRATIRRVDALAAAGSFPLPPEGWPAIPWPAF